MIGGSMKYAPLLAFVLYLNGAQSGSFDYFDGCMVRAVNWVFAKNAVYYEGMAYGERVDGRNAICVDSQTGQTLIRY